jgi:hypothetical protein
VETQIDISDAEHRKNQEDTHHDHEDIGLAGLGDVERKMMGRHRMELFLQSTLPELGVGGTLSLASTRMPKAHAGRQI